MSPWRWRSGKFWLRLAVAYAVVPWTAPILIVLFIVLGGQHLAFGDWFGMVALYSIFSFAAMLILGVPLLFLYSRLNFAGFLPFVIGGGCCALATYALMAPTQVQVDQYVIFTVFGLGEGFILRVILFGFATPSQEEHPVNQTWMLTARNGEFDAHRVAFRAEP